MLGLQKITSRGQSESEPKALALLKAAKACEALVAEIKATELYHPAIYHLESASRDLRKAYGLFA